ncbi:MAG: hypothetical protein EPN21_13430 [Methylococcaceae bacterium]|nr:MAG: hypothetical protein EPN21_13430 [Methylococcaceae bacterium]
MRRVLALCLWTIAASAGAAADEWQESALKAATLEKVYQIANQYQRCMVKELQSQVGSDQDSRALTDSILKKCEPQLSPMRDVFTAEKVPAEMAERYLKKTRTQAARNLIREVMAMQAQRGLMTQ